MKYRVIIEKDEDGVYVAEAISLYKEYCVQLSENRG